MKCTKHPHSSITTAMKCGATQGGRRADRLIRTLGLAHNKTIYTQIKHSPPLEIIKNGILIYIFYSARPQS